MLPYLKALAILILLPVASPARAKDTTDLIGCAARLRSIVRSNKPHFRRHAFVRGFVRVMTPSLAQRLAADMAAGAPSWFTVAAHHFDMPDEARAQVLNDFYAGRINVVITDHDLTATEVNPDLTTLVRGTMSQFMSREEFLALLKAHGIRSQLEFRRHFREARPGNVPIDPKKIYEMTWSAMTQNAPRIYARRTTARFTLMDLREFLIWVHQNKITGYNDFLSRFTTASDRPAGVPSNPHSQYRMKWFELVDRARRLADGDEGAALEDVVRPPKRTFRSVDQFISWARDNGVTSRVDFNDRFGSNRTRPIDVPSAPYRYYQMPWAELIYHITK